MSGEIARGAAKGGGPDQTGETKLDPAGGSSAGQAGRDAQTDPGQHPSCSSFSSFSSFFIPTFLG